MNNPYRNLMEQQSLSETANAAFYAKLDAAAPQKKKRVLQKAILVAACVCLLIPTAVLAAEHILGSTFVELVERSFVLGKPGEGYDVHFTGVYSRPITDFTPELQCFDGYKSEGYESWEAAEAALGIDLFDNSVLSDEETHREKQYDREVDSETHVSGSNLQHCVADYSGKGGQFYRAGISAAYQRNEININVNAVVTAKHPAIPAEEVEGLHRIGTTYPQTDVEEIAQEQYTTKTGLTATIVTVDRGDEFAFYEASFAANGASYRVGVNAYNSERNQEAKELLIDILEGFSF